MFLPSPYSVHTFLAPAKPTRGFLITALKYPLRCISDVAEELSDAIHAAQVRL